MIRTNISLPEELYERLREKKFRENRSLSEMVREALEGYLFKEVKSSLEKEQDAVKIRKDICEHGLPKSLCKRCMFK